MGSGVYMYGGKKGRVEKKRRKKKLKGKKLNWFYLYVYLFGAKCRIVKIYLEDVYDIFYHKWFVYISIVHTIYISLYFFIILFKFYKNVCKEMCTNHDLFFFISRH